MIYWLLMIPTLIASIACGIIFGSGFLEGIGIGVLVLLVCELIAMLISVLLSLWLGKTSQTVLKKTISIPIIHLDSDSCTLQGGAEINLSTVDNIIFVDDDIQPYIVVNRYNIGGWRRWLLFELYDDRIQYFVYLPKNNKTKD